MPDDPETKRAIRKGKQPGLLEIYPKPLDHSQTPPAPRPEDTHTRQVRQKLREEEGARD